jgi:hypothetical protein
LTKKQTEIDYLDVFSVLNPIPHACGAKGRVFESRLGRLYLGVILEKSLYMPICGLFVLITTALLMRVAIDINP